MLWPIARSTGTDGASLSPAPCSLRTRRRATAPQVKRWSVLFNASGTIVDVNVLFCTRRFWDRRTWDTEGWNVLDLGPFFVIAVKVIS